MPSLSQLAPSRDEIRSDAQTDSKWSWCSANPKRNLAIFLTQFLMTYTTILIIIIVSLYNLTVQSANREIWIGLVSWMGGVIIPSPASMKANKVIYPVKAGGQDQGSMLSNSTLLLRDEVDSVPSTSNTRSRPPTEP